MLRYKIFLNDFLNAPIEQEVLVEDSLIFS